MAVDWSPEQVAEKVYEDMERHASNAAVKRRQAAIPSRPETYADLALSIARDEAKIEALSTVHEWLTGKNSFDTAHEVKAAAG